MDWVNQNKFRNWLIVVLLASNLLTVSIIWMQTAKTHEPGLKEREPRSSESVQLMRKALDLTEGQTRQLEQMRNVQLEQSKKYNDRMAVLKRALAEELFTDKPDTARATLKAKEIGELQSHVELIRFRHFNDLLAICTPEQKEKLKPIVTELFGRKPPKDELKEGRQPDGRKEENQPRDKTIGDTGREKPQDRQDDRPQPPSVDEKLAKYSDRLNLTDEQARRIRAVLLRAEQEGEQLRMRVNPDRHDIQTEKERIRKEEDDGIMKVLNEDQKNQFAKMISERRQ